MVIAAAILVAGLMNLGVMDSVQDKELKVMTYNLRYGTAQDGENSWPYRKESLLDLVKRVDPDVLGVQEALASQIDELRAALPGHDVLGGGRDDGIRKGEFSAMFYRRDRMGLREGGMRWISDTPEVPGSKGPGTTLPRVFSWGEFLVDGKRVLILNAHFDHQSPAARLMGAQQMRSFAESRKGIPSVMTGDFNCNLGSDPLDWLVAGGWKACRPDTGPYVTFNGFDAKVTAGEAIDFVMVSPGVTVLETVIDRTLTPDGRTPSDHYPVIARLTLTD
jgi:endonuclease/exonuclease/phosphatase family metal-dependent hydrolase